MSELKRYTTDDMRVYTDEDELYLPSVTSVLDQRDEPAGIKYWKEKNDGTNGTTHWRDILQYKSNRGTMIHYHLLNEFADGDMYSTEEDDSEEELKLEGNWDRYQSELAYAEEAWERVKQTHGISDESVLDVECFVTNVSVGYAGQFDLLYVNDESEICLADLKTGKGIYDSYKMQLTAYENALNLDIDKLQIIRIYPDGEEWEVSSSDEWHESRDDLWRQFRALRAEMGDIGEQLEQIAENGINAG